MSIRNKNKDHLKAHGGVELVALSLAPISDDPLRFWTNHPVESILVDLHVFADGESEHPNPNGGGAWSGPFSGRPELIAELAPAIQARLTLMSASSCTSHKQALRMLWRVCDQVEATVAADGRKVERLGSVRNLTHLHEATMHLAKVHRSIFGAILSLINDTRRLMRLRPLPWTTPKGDAPNRQLIPDSHAKALKIGIKRDWEQVRKTWERHDAIQQGKEPDTLVEFKKQHASTVLQYAEENKQLRQNWLHFARIQKTTGMLLPTSDKLYEGMSPREQRRKGFFLTQMRAIVFPTAEEAHIAFHAALMGSGWNPATLITGIDATLPERIFQHPKDTRQSVLVVDELQVQDESEDIEVTMQGSKRRAGGRLQFCMGLKKNPDSPPNIVAAYLERTRSLREQLRQDAKKTHAELARLTDEDAPKKEVESQFKQLQTLQQGLRNVWLYVSKKGDITWIDGKEWKAFWFQNGAQNGQKSYLDHLIDRLNVERAVRRAQIEKETAAARTELQALQSWGDRPMEADAVKGQAFEMRNLAVALRKLALQKMLFAREEAVRRLVVPIKTVVTSDLRDIFARWVHLQTGGNVIAVMFALGHAGLRSTNGYLDNNIFSAENDETVRRFMTALFKELELRRVDLTILAQLVRHGPLTPEMQERLTEYRRLMLSRVKARCKNPKHPPSHIEPDHVKGEWCSTHRCLRDCSNAIFLPESLDGIAMRVEEMMVMSEHLPVDTWVRGGFEEELAAGEYLLAELYPSDAVTKARMHWHDKIHAGKHVVPGVGLITEKEAE